jgi:DNA-binding NarL/FixJ family response regulator
MRSSPAAAMLEDVVSCLIVDDSTGFLAAARQLLERQGMTVAAVASTGDEAERRLVQTRPDVVLVDIDLGGESGLELAERFGRYAGSLPVAIILISTHAEQDYRDLIAASPAIGFVPKSELSADAILTVLRAAAGGAAGA